MNDFKKIFISSTGEVRESEVKVEVKEDMAVAAQSVNFGMNTVMTQVVASGYHQWCNSHLQGIS